MIRQSGKQLGVAQLGSALEWGSRGRKFKSSHPDHAGTQLKAVFFACRVRSRYFCVTLARACTAIVTPGIQHAFNVSYHLLLSGTVKLVEELLDLAFRHACIRKKLGGRPSAYQLVYGNVEKVRRLYQKSATHLVTSALVVRKRGTRNGKYVRKLLLCKSLLCSQFL